MFQAGDLVMYGTTGVCRVEEITTPVGGTTGKPYYLLKPLYQNGTVYTPVENGKVPMRSILTAAEADALIDAIPTVQASAVSGTTLQAVAAQYQTALRSNDCYELLRLMKSIYQKQHPASDGKQRGGNMEERFRKQGESLLYGELAAALEIPIGEVPAYIARRLEAMEQETT